MERNDQSMYLLCGFLVMLSLGGILLLTAPKLNFIGYATGFAILEETEIKEEFQYTAPEEITRETAFQALLETEAVVKEIQDFDLSTYFVQDTLLKAKRAFIGDDPNHLTTALKQAADDETELYLQSLLQTAEQTPLYEIERQNYSEVIKLTPTKAKQLLRVG